MGERGLKRETRVCLHVHAAGLLLPDRQFRRGYEGETERNKVRVTAERGGNNLRYPAREVFLVLKMEDCVENAPMFHTVETTSNCHR